MNKQAKELVELINSAKDKGTKPYDTQATVVRIDGNTAWVHIPGGVDETPVQKTIDAQEGDLVLVRVSGGSAWITGNSSRPPTDDTLANVADVKATTANNTAIGAEKTAGEANENATEAKAMANEINNHFWTDAAGAHVTELPHDATQGNNILIDNDSVDVREGEKTIASFGEETQLGEDENAHLLLNFNSLKLINKESDEVFVVKDLRNAEGIATITVTQEASGTNTLFPLFTGVPSALAIDNNYLVTVNGVEVTSGVTKDSSSVRFSSPPARGDIVEIVYQTESKNVLITTIGFREGTEGIFSTAIGYEVESSGQCSYAEGVRTVSNGHASHSEGISTTASNASAHAEGLGTEARGYASHAQNYGTIARGEAQTALGRYNIEDTENKYAVIVGRGNSSAKRLNALAVMWDGNIEIRLSNQTSPGTTDSELYTAIRNLGWEGDVWYDA